MKQTSVICLNPTSITDFNKVADIHTSQSPTTGGYDTSRLMSQVNDRTQIYPLVSIVVCTYNRANYLDQCIKSLLNQSYPNLEIIVVNGPSIDNTSDVLEKYNMIKILNQHKLDGLSAARNIGIKESRGEIIAFIDDDAIADNDWIKYLIFGYQSKSVGGVGGLVYGPQKSAIQFDNGSINKYGLPTLIRKVNRKLSSNEFPILMGTNCSFRRETLFEIGGFDPYFKYYHDESDLCIRIKKKGKDILFNRDAVVIHEMAEGYNRQTPHDLNWYEIMKNIIYFIIKNFNQELASYTFRPIIALFQWLKYAGYLWLNREISAYKMFCISAVLTKGAIRGYIDGFKGNYHLHGGRGWL